MKQQLDYVLMQLSKNYFFPYWRIAEHCETNDLFSIIPVHYVLNSHFPWQLFHTQINALPPTRFLNLGANFIP